MIALPHELSHAGHRLGHDLLEAHVVLHPVRVDQLVLRGGERSRSQRLAAGPRRCCGGGTSSSAAVMGASLELAILLRARRGAPERKKSCERSGAAHEHTAFALWPRGVVLAAAPMTAARNAQRLRGARAGRGEASRACASRQKFVLYSSKILAKNYEVRV